ncbi:MAG: ester cyclase [Pseudomonadota bacterium]
MLSREEMDRLIDAHFKYEQSDDVAGVLETLTPDVEHDVVGWPPGPSHGPDAARGFYERLFADLADTRITPVRRLYGDGFAVDESLAESTAVGAPFGLPGRNRRISFRLLHVFEFDGGRIRRENVWLDLAAIQQQLGEM